MPPKDFTMHQFILAAKRNGFELDYLWRLRCPVLGITYCRVWEGNNIEARVDLRATLAKALRLREEDRTKLAATKGG